MDKLAEGFLLDKAKVAWYVENYLQNGEDRKSVSPVYGEFYSSMPATMVITAAYDPLQDEGIAYYNNVVNIGVNAKLMQVDHPCGWCPNLQDAPPGMRHPLCEQRCNPQLSSAQICFPTRTVCAAFSLAMGSPKATVGCELAEGLCDWRTVHETMCCKEAS